MKKKVFIIIGTVFILVIGLNMILNRNNDYYRNVADLSVGLFKNKNYDRQLIKSKDLQAIEDFLSMLTHENQVIDLSEYIVKEKEYYTSSHNTNGVYKKDGKCFIDYKKLEFDKPIEEINYEMEPHKMVVCDNYYVVLYESMFFPDYSVTQSNPIFDYHFEEEIKNEKGYDFIYYSSYDSSRLKLSFLIENKTIKKIDIKFLDKR
ncbi:MAG: hypothetical protein E7167_00045 [Firmicutes bacterium]|nr:hypothetical protein [Bacillota bacterium]